MKKILIALLTTLPVLCAPLQAQDSAALQALLTNDAGRPDADKARDAGRRPAEVLNFLGVQSGQTVVDLIAAAVITLKCSLTQSGLQARSTCKIQPLL